MLGQSRTGSEYDKNMEKIYETLKTRVFLQPYKHLFNPKKDSTNVKHKVLKWAHNGVYTPSSNAGGEGVDLIRLINNHSTIITNSDKTPRYISDFFSEKLSTELVPLIALINSAGKEASYVRKKPICIRIKENEEKRNPEQILKEEKQEEGKETDESSEKYSSLRLPQTLATSNREGLMDMYHAESMKYSNSVDEVTGAAGDEALIRLLEGLDKYQVLLLCTFIRCLYISPSKHHYKTGKRNLVEFERNTNADGGNEGAKASKFDQRKALSQFYKVLEITLKNLKPLVKH